MTWDESKTDNFVQRGGAGSGVRNMRTRQVNRRKISATHVNPERVDTFIKNIAKASAKLFIKDKEKEAKKLAEIDSNKVLNVVDKGMKVATGALLGLAGVKAIGNQLGKKSDTTIQTVDRPQPTIVAPPVDVVKKPTISAPSPFMATTGGKSSEPLQQLLTSEVPLSSQITKAGDAPTGNGLVAAVQNLAESIPANDRQSILEKGRELLESGTGKVTDAQKKLQQLGASVGLLPKTKRLKDAETLLTMPQTASIVPTQIGGFDSRWVFGIMIALLIISAFVYFNK